MPSDVSKLYKIRFEETRLKFNERYPEGLRDVLPVVDFDSVIRRINEEMTTKIIESTRLVRKWSYIVLGLSVVLVGPFLTPVLFIRTRRQKAALKNFWEDLRKYLAEINRKTFLPRNLEWKLVEDTHKLKSRDVVNPLLCYRIELIHYVKRRAGTAVPDGSSADDTVTVGDRTSQSQISTLIAGSSGRGKMLSSSTPESKEETQDDTLSTISTSSSSSLEPISTSTDQSAAKNDVPTTASPEKEPASFVPDVVAVSEPAKESVSEPVKEAVSEPVKEPVSEPVKEAVSEPAKESVSQPVKEAVSEPAKESAKESPPVPLVASPAKQPSKSAIVPPETPPVSEPKDHKPKADESSAKKSPNAKFYGLFEYEEGEDQED